MCTREDGNQERLSFENSGDNNTIPLPVSPAPIFENGAQNSGAGDACDTGDKVLTSIYRLGYSDTWACKNCKQKDDKWFMQKHTCEGQSSK